MCQRGGDCITVKNNTGGATIYEHAGWTASTDSSFTVSPESIRGIAWDGSNLLIQTIAAAGGHIRRYVGFSSTVDTTLSWGTVYGKGLGWNFNTGNMLSCSTSTVYLHSGFSVTVLDTIAVTPTQSYMDITTDGTNTLLYTGSDNLIRVLEGFSGTVLDSFAPPAGASNIIALCYVPYLTY